MTSALGVEREDPSLFGGMIGDAKLAHQDDGRTADNLTSEQRELEKPPAVPGLVATADGNQQPAFFDQQAQNPANQIHASQDFVKAASPPTSLHFREWLLSGARWSGEVDDRVVCRSPRLPFLLD